MGFPILLKWYLFIESGPGTRFQHCYVLLWIDILLLFFILNSLANQWSKIDATWAVRCLKSTPTPLFVQVFVQNETKRRDKSSALLALCAGNHWWPVNAWWRHQMETFCALLALWGGGGGWVGGGGGGGGVGGGGGEFTGHRLNERLSKQSWGWWFETPSRPLWRHCNGITWIR